MTIPFDSACIALNNLSVVDHAYIDNEGKVVGGSFNPSFLVAGKVNEIEKVVVDFFTVKKDLKKIIDDYTYGYDHKLWIIKGYSKVEIVADPDYRSYYDQSKPAIVGPNKPRIVLKTPKLTLELPFDAIRFIDNARDHSIHEIGWSFQQYVQTELQKVHPESKIEVECYNNIDRHQLIASDNPGSYFTYVHGLKDSTSYGCQNNSHGHLSFIQLLKASPGELQYGDAELLALQQKIATELDGTIFIRRENLFNLHKQDVVSIRYETPKRGLFIAEYQRAGNKLKILETETTIEYLADYIGNLYGSQMKAIGVQYFLVSEGLSKGAFLKL